MLCCLQHRYCLFTGPLLRLVQSELRKPEEAAPQRVVNEDETRLSGARQAEPAQGLLWSACSHSLKTWSAVCAGAQLLQQQQLTQALTAILANGAAGSPGQNGFHHPTGPEVRRNALLRLHVQPQPVPLVIVTRMQHVMLTGVDVMLAESGRAFVFASQPSGRAGLAATAAAAAPADAAGHAIAAARGGGLAAQQH